jgi:transcriptional regulator with XRE-family HTH domain
MKRGRPKGRSRDNRSFGPLGDLIRSHRLAKGLGLLDVAKACGCSVQFVSNIEHGRAPLPWEKVGPMAAALKIPSEDLQAANLAIRSDFKSFVSNSRGRKTATPMVLSKMTGTASAVAFAAKDNALREVIQKYQSASPESRKKFVRQALQMLAH